MRSFVEGLIIGYLALQALAVAYYAGKPRPMITPGAVIGTTIVQTGLILGVVWLAS